MQTGILVVAVLMVAGSVIWAMTALLNATLRRDAAIRANPLLEGADNAYLGAAAAGSGAAACSTSSCS